MSLDSRLRRGLIELGEGFDPDADLVFEQVARRGASGLRTRRIAIAVLAVVALVGGVNAAAIVDAVTSIWRVERVERSDPVTSFPLRGTPVALLGSGDDLLVAVARGNEAAIVHVDRNTAARELVRFNGRLLDAAAADGTVWALVDTGSRRSLLRFDARNGELKKKVAVPSGESITAGFGAVWVLGIDERVTRFAGASLKRGRSVELDFSVLGMEAGAGGVWLDTTVGPVMRIDPVAVAITERYPKTDLEDVGSSGAWLSRSAGNGIKDLIRIDASTARGVAWGGVPQGSIVAATGERAWMLRPTPRGNEVVRLEEPGRLFATRVVIPDASLESPRVVDDVLLALDRSGPGVVLVDLDEFQDD